MFIKGQKVDPACCTFHRGETILASALVEGCPQCQKEKAQRWADIWTWEDRKADDEWADS